MLAGARSGWSTRLLAETPLLAALATLAVLDLRSRLLPDVLTLPTLGYALVLAGIRGALPGIWHAALDALIGGGLVLLVAIATRGGIGGGDIKLVAVLGAAVGWKAALLSLALSQLGGIALLVAILVVYRRRPERHLPVGALIALLGAAMFVGRP